MNSNKKTILVTGGAGYIGSHTCKALANAGFLPVTYDNLSRGYESFVKWGPLEIGDILDTKKFRSVLKKYQPSAVLHFASFAYVGESNKEPLLYYENNVSGTLSVIKSMTAEHISNIVFSSSCATYGIPNKTPISENTFQNPVNTYGSTKLICEQMIKKFDNSYNFPYIILRYFNATGADPDGEIGESHSPEPHLIPRAILASLGKIEHLEIYGSDYNTPDGTCIRDYIHVSDLADAHVLAVQSLLENKKSDCYNLGIGNGFSNKQILEAIYNVTQKKVPHKYVDRRVGDPSELIANAQKVKRALNWSPKYNNLETMIKHSQNWLVSQQDTIKGKL